MFVITTCIGRAFVHGFTHHQYSVFYQIAWKLMPVKINEFTVRCISKASILIYVSALLQVIHSNKRSPINVIKIFFLFSLVHYVHVWYAKDIHGPKFIKVIYLVYCMFAKDIYSRKSLSSNQYIMYNMIPC